MTALVFVDTNVFVYARDAGEPRKQPIAAAWLAHVWQDQSGRTSAQVLSEYYVTVTRKLDPGLTQESAWEDVRTLFAWRPQAVDAAVLLRGREIEQKYGLSWWDSLIVAAAQLQNCALLLSEGLQDGGLYDGLVVRSPFTLGINESLAAYASMPSVGGGHRPRGRPKRATP